MAKLDFDRTVDVARNFDRTVQIDFDQRFHLARGRHVSYVTRVDLRLVHTIYDATWVNWILIGRLMLLEMLIGRSKLILIKDSIDFGFLRV